MMNRVALALVAVVGCADEDVSEDHARGPVTVRVIRGPVAVAGAAVAFADEHGHLRDSGITDADGVVTGVASANGMVTVLDPELERSLTTITNVAIGSTFELPLEDAFGARGPEIGTLTIEMPTTAPPGDTMSYTVFTPCGAELVYALPATVPLRAGCEGDVPVLVFAVSPPLSLEDPGLGLAYVAAIAGEDRVVRPGAWSSDCAQVAIGGDVQMDVHLRSRLGGHQFHWVSDEFCPYVSGAAAVIGLGDGAVASAFTFPGSPDGESTVLRDLAMLPAAVAFNESELLRGTVTHAGHDGASVAWMATPALSAADMLEVNASWLLEPVEYVRWRFVLPASAPRALVPELPDGMRTWASLETEFTVLEVRYSDASWIDSIGGVHAELPLLVDAHRSHRELPRGGTLRGYRANLYR